MATCLQALSGRGVSANPCMADTALRRCSALDANFGGVGKLETAFSGEMLFMLNRQMNRGVVPV